jgi:hypothetical protein
MSRNANKKLHLQGANEKLNHQSKWHPSSRLANTVRWNISSAIDSVHQITRRISASHKRAVVTRKSLPVRLRSWLSVLRMRSIPVCANGLATLRCTMYASTLANCRERKFPPIVHARYHLHCPVHGNLSHFYERAPIDGAPHHAIHTSTTKGSICARKVQASKGDSNSTTVSFILDCFDWFSCCRFVVLCLICLITYTNCCVRCLRYRVFNVLKHWVEKYHWDFSENPPIQKLFIDFLKAKALGNSSVESAASKLQATLRQLVCVSLSLSLL